MAEGLSIDEFRAYRDKIQSWRSWNPPEGGNAGWFLIAAVVAVAIGAWTALWFYFSNSYHQADTPTCNSTQMRPGDTCVTQMPHGGHTYRDTYENLVSHRDWTGIITSVALAVVVLVVALAAIYVIIRMIRKIQREARTPTQEEATRFIDRTNAERRRLEASIAQTGSSTDRHRLKILEKHVRWTVKGSGINIADGIVTVVEP